MLTDVNGCKVGIHKLNMPSVQTTLAPVVAHAAMVFVETGGRFIRDGWLCKDLDECKLGILMRSVCSVYKPHRN